MEVMKHVEGASEEVIKKDVAPTQTVEQADSPQPEVPEDLLKRVSNFKSETPEDKPEGSQANYQQQLEEKIARIEDPEMRATYLSLEKEIMRGANERFQKAADMRKEAELLSQNKQEPEWTPERVRHLVSDPKFVNAAQQVANEPEDSLADLDEDTKNYIKGLESKLNVLEQKSNQADQSAQMIVRNQQHEQLKTKYADYDPVAVDTITADMISGKIQPTPEHIYKAFNYETAMEKSYRMGREDERSGVQEKIQSTSLEGITTSPSNEVLVPEKGESRKQLWNRIAAKAMKAALK